MSAQLTGPRRSLVWNQPFIYREDGFRCQLLVFRNVANLSEIVFTKTECRLLTEKRLTLEALQPGTLQHMASLPNTLIAGVGKSGTTSLCADLAVHEDVYVYHSKETNYFTFNYDKGEEWFRGLFSPASEKIILDGSADLTLTGQTDEIFDRVAALLPKARMLFMVRHPIRRIESHYVQELANGRPVLPFHEALEAWHLISGSLYNKTLNTILDRFSADQIHILFFEDYLSDKPGCPSSEFFGMLSLFRNGGSGSVSV